MTPVPLRDLLEKMRTQLQDGQFADVMALGQHVLRYYPKHIETYGLLAEASLEAGELTAAADLFQRVRGADPENIFALVGLSIVHEQRKEFEEAIWHLERAFEIQPANEELRKELLRLYAEQEGTSRERLKLTPGGLARLYARQGLYSQAIQEFRALLRRDPARTDVQAALAEVLYRVGRKQDAAEIAQALLDKLPYCLKANLLLGALWSENGVPEAQALMQRAQSLDPENKVARGLIPDHWDDLPPPMLPAMSEEPVAAPPPAPSLPKLDGGDGQEVSLLASLIPGSEPAPQAKLSAPPQAPIEQQSALPGTTLEPEQGPLVTTPPQASQQEPLSPTQLAEMPPPKVTGEPVPARRVQPSLPRVGPTIPGALEKLPAWLRGAAAPASTAVSPTPSAGSVGSTSVVAERAAGSARLLELAQSGRADALGQAQSNKPQANPESPGRGAQVPAPKEPQSTDMPAWLTRARQAARSGELEESIPGPSAPEEKPSWLTEAEAGASPKEGPPSTPQWLMANSPDAAADQARAQVEGTLPTWLAASDADERVETTISDATLPDWLSPTEEAEPAAPQSAPAANVAVPDWLKTPVPSEAQPAGSPVPEAPAAGAIRQQEVEETIPEWLREITQAKEGEPAASAPMAAQPFGSGRPESTAPAVIETDPSVQAGTAVTTPEFVQSEPSAAASVPPAEMPAGPAGVEAVPSTPSFSSVEANAESTAVEAVLPEPSTPADVLDSRLAQARQVWASGNYTGAIELYEKALQGGTGLTADVIADFERFVQEPDVPMPAHRLLGDAYSMVGRYKEALEQYRVVLGK